MSTLSDGKTMNPTAQPGDAKAERRASARGPASSIVLLCPDTPMSAAFPASLVEVSETGFRAHYPLPAMKEGQVVRFMIPRRWGAAMALWTRVEEGRAETGFLILKEVAK